MHDEGTDSKVKIFANIFISFIGAGILGLPYAFKEVRFLSKKVATPEASWVSDENRLVLLKASSSCLL